MTTTPAPAVQQEVQQQAGKLLGHFAGHVAFKTIQMGLENGLFKALSQHESGCTAAELAQRTGTDRFFAEVWARAAYAAELIEVQSDGRYSLAPHLDQLILNEDFPGYLGGIPAVFGQPEMFDRFSAHLKTGARIWWDDASPSFIQAVSKTGRPFYNRLIPTGLEKVHGLDDTLSRGATVAELACGLGYGLEKFARTFPNTQLQGVDGDSHSANLARRHVADLGLGDRVDVVHSALEDFVADDTFDLVFINISMHECRDIDKVTQNVHRSLKQGGYFVISDFPFPATHEGLRTLPARVMTGIQYFEAQIDDQLMPTDAFTDLLDRHGFREVGAFEISPVHNLIHGRK